MNNESMQSIAVPKGEIVLYQPDENITLEVKLDTTRETVWLTQQQIADLFGTKQPAISKHLSNIYKSGELDEDSTYSILEYMGNDGKQKYKTKYYNLDVIISVGYRVNSVNATAFRRWATNVLRDYLLKGYSVNHQLIALQQHEDLGKRLFAFDLMGLPKSLIMSQVARYTVQIWIQRAVTQFFTMRQSTIYKFNG